MISDWKSDLHRGAHRVEELRQSGHLDGPGYDAALAVSGRFAFRVSAYYLSLIDWEDPNCPIRRQAIPDARELDALDSEWVDPTGDRPHRPTPLLVHRYANRLLLWPTLQCSMICRFCFRKVLLNDDAGIRLRTELPAAIEYLRAHPEVHEVILSGGDPLLLDTPKLEELLGALRTVDTVRRIRVHTRVPATLPSRIDEALVEVLRNHGPVRVIAHYNHPRELTEQATEAIDALVQAGVPVDNQNVLMRGINDSAEVLEALYEGLLDRGVRPYYLHHPDLTVGTQHFRVSLEQGRALYASLRGRLSGPAIPAYMLEIPGGHGKIRVDGPRVVATATEGVWMLESPFGGWHRYVDPVHWPAGKSPLDPSERVATNGPM